MLAAVKKFIRSADHFPFLPEESLVYNKAKAIKTLPGGIWSIALFVSLGLLWYQYLY